MDRKTILLVEDNSDDVELTLRAFNKVSFANRLDVAHDGAEALDYLFCEGAYAGRSPADQPTVVLLDLKLPRVDGLEVLRRLRADDRTCHLPVVVLTSSREERDIIESYKCGCNAFVRKPVDFVEFLQAASSLGLFWLLLNERPPGQEGDGTG